MKKLIFLILILSLGLLSVACTSEAVTTTPESTEAPATWLPESSTAADSTTTPITTVPMTTTLPKITEAPAWMAKIEKDLFEKAVEEDGKYYIYLSYFFRQDGYAVHDNETFVDAYVADRKDIVFANLEYGAISRGIYLRATAAEIEAYAKNTYVTGIYSYPADKVIDGCKATIQRMDSLLLIDKMREIANGGGSLPLVKVSSKEELAAFKTACIYEYPNSYTNEVFSQIASLYDDAYFAEKTLFLIGSENGTGSEEYSFVHAIKDNGVQIVLDLTCPYIVTHDMAYWLIFVEMDNSAISDQSVFSVIVK